ncbi:hypothetical protein HYY75_00035 [bacterium]|nr:hypothetical protein [bacterium]
MSSTRPEPDGAENKALPRLTWVVFCCVFCGIPLLIFFFLFKGIIDERKIVFQRRVEDKLELLLARFLRWEKTEEFMGTLLRQFSKKFSPSGFSPKYVSKVLENLNKRFPGVFDFIFLNGSGEILQEISQKGAPKTILKKLFNALEKAKHGDMTAVQKDFKMFSSFIGSIQSSGNIGFEQLKPSFLSDKKAFAFINPPGPNGMFLVFLNRVKNWDNLGLEDCIRRFNSRNKSSKSQLIDLSKSKGIGREFLGVDPENNIKVISWLMNGRKNTLWLSDRILGQSLLGSSIRLVVKMDIPEGARFQKNLAGLVILETAIFLSFSFFAWLIQYCNWTILSSVRVNRNWKRNASYFNPFR